MTQPPANRVLSGIQPTGHVHLGNYLGAIVNWVKLQATHECLYCIVDMHAITVWQDPAALEQSVRQTAAIILAAGIDAEKHILFNQSRVGAHAELAWILNCTARLGWLNRMTQFKEKAGKDRENASIGLYAYPVLMAADILTYRASHVPVGDDQKQHLELARDIAGKFNKDYAERISSLGFTQDFFTPPEPLITGPATRVMSLRDGTQKMSKSDPSDNSRINLTDTVDMIAQKIRKAKTDTEPLPSETAGLEGRAEAANLVGIFAALSNRAAEDILKEFGGGQFSAFKNALADLTLERIAPITSRMRDLLADTSAIDKVLARGAERADAIAAPVLAETKKVIGFLS